MLTEVAMIKSVASPASAPVVDGGVAGNGTSAARADWWCRVLDERTVDVGVERWRAEVVGIHSDAHHLWIQLRSAADWAQSVVLKVTWRTTLADALAALRTPVRGTSIPWMVDASAAPRSLRRTPPCDMAAEPVLPAIVTRDCAVSQAP
jgi:hypothetical protein